jgi:hypothetical protein
MIAKRDKRSQFEDEEDLELLPGEQATEADQDEDDEVEVVLLTPNGKHRRKTENPRAEEDVDFAVIDADINAEEVIDDMDDYSDDEEVIQDLAERQRFLNHGSDDLAERLRRHHSKDPDLSGGDIDAAWHDSDVSGEESVGGSAPTPDQDVVDELGEALGIEYSDAEPLHTEEKLQNRDRNRWELNPASAEDLVEQEEEVDDLEKDEIEEILEEDEELDLEALEDEDDLEELDEEIDGLSVDLEEDEIEDELAEDEEEDEDLDDYELEDDELDDYLDDLYDDEDEDDDVY